MMLLMRGVERLVAPLPGDNDTPLDLASTSWADDSTFVQRVPLHS